MKTSRALALTGFSLIAVSYGLARFSWGLMLPAVTQDIPFSAQVAGIIAACSFVAYCVAISTASRLTARFGPRRVAGASAIFATAGLLLLAVSASPVMLAAGIFIAGLSAGLSSPALAVAVNRAINEQLHTQANTVINAGTGAGIVLSVPVLQFLPGGWRAACVAFAFLALLCLLPVMRYLPREGHSYERKNWRQTFFQRQVIRLACIAFMSGVASAAWWSFGPNVLREHAGVASNIISILWLVCGAAGMAGALTGPVSRIIGMRQVYRLAQLFMAVPLLLIAFSHAFSWWMIPAVALCGVGYITLSGVLLVGGTQVTPDSPATGVGVAFFMLAAGQVAGSVVFGIIYTHTGALPALLCFAMLSLVMLCYVPETGAEPGRKNAEARY
ncbi:MFS transporter [Vagococcus sp. WN89Y]|uniref:MFS transporter n=1 Tax=Vagococcus sp. WN89Y TaxID=3457258 RepID=UPI003FCD03B5